MENFIAPLQRISTFTEISSTQKTSETAGGLSLFRSIFENAAKDVIDTQKNLETQQYLLATGQIDDVHSVSIAAAEAELTVDMLVQLRNSAIDAYNELLRINL